MVHFSIYLNANFANHIIQIFLNSDSLIKLYMHQNNYHELKDAFLCLHIFHQLFLLGIPSFEILPYLIN